MNKLKMTLAAAVSAISMGAMCYTVNDASNTLAAVRSAADVAVTNKTDAFKTIRSLDLFAIHACAGCVSGVYEVGREIDGILAGLGYSDLPRSVTTWSYGTDPSYVFSGVASNYMQSAGISDMIPNTIAVARKYGYPVDASLGTVCTLTEAVSILSEFSSAEKAKSSAIVLGGVGTAKIIVRNAALIQVKRKLRTDGKSFVTKNGVNPCAAYMSGLITALNAPYYAGLNDWLSSMGETATVDVSGLPVAADADALKTAILYGEKEPTAYNKYVLTLCLGVSAYNEFVRAYNGD